MPDRTTKTALQRRQPRASRLSSRVDVYFRLIDDPDGDLLGISMLVPNKVSWERNRPGEADTMGLGLPGMVFPFDLGIIAPKSGFVSVWLFEHGTPEACLAGDRGHYFGVIDDIKRRRGRTVSISSRDMTAIPLDAKMTEDGIKRFAIEAMSTLEDIVRALIHQVPGTFNWRVRSLCAEATKPGLVVPPIIVPGKQRKGSKAPAPPTVLSPGTVHLSDIVSTTQELSVWTAIANVCARHGVVPEVIVDQEGPLIVLIDASDLQTTDVFRPFKGRGGKTTRVFVDGDGISEISETLTLTNGPKRPEFVQVDSYDPIRGVGVSARWPPRTLTTKKERKAAGEDSTEEGLQQFVRGLTSQVALTRMARAGWEALSHNGFEVDIDISEPWSAGGDPSDPDVLDMAYGCAIECAMPSFDQLAKQPGLDTPAKILRAQRVSEVLISRIIKASEKLGAMSLVFQTVRVRHEWAGGTSPTYKASINARRFMGTTEMPLLSDAPDIRQIRAKSGIVP